MAQAYYRTKLDALTSLRFFAASAIVLHHLRGQFGLSEDFLGTAQPAQGVSFFFVLSGFILTYAYPQLASWEDRCRFWLARFARIWPAHVAALVLLFVLGAILSFRVPTGAPTLLANIATSAPTLLANIALVHAWVPVAGFFFSYNAVSWSISTELGFYLFFPLLIMGFAKSWWWKLTGALALALGTIVVCKALNIPSYPHHGVVTMGIFEISPLGRIFEFVLGMTAALFWLSWLRHIRVPVVLGTVLEIGAIFFVFENVQLNSWPAPLAVQYGEPGVDWLFMSWTPALPSAFLIMVMASRVGWLGQWLSTKPLVFLGEISFSIYLTHHILLRAFVAAGLGSHLGTLAIPVYILSVLGLSTLIWLAVERPARAFIVRLWPKETGFAIPRAEAQVSVSAGVR